MYTLAFKCVSLPLPEKKDMSGNLAGQSNDTSGKQGWHTVHRFTCCICWWTINIDVNSIHFQHLQNCSVSCWGYGDRTVAFFIEIKSSNSKSWVSAPNCDFWTVSRLLNTLCGCLLHQYWHLFLTYPEKCKLASSDVIRLWRTTTFASRIPLNHPQNTTLAFLSISRCQLWNSDFIWVKTEVIKQNVVQISVQNVRSNTLISGIARMTLDHNFPNFINSLCFAD
jgi:hypothetical protein